MCKDKHGWLGLDGQVCVVTGAAGGIGYSIADVLARAGAYVALLDMNERGCFEAAEKLSAETGAKTCAAACDITKPDSVSAAAKKVESKLGAASVLVNNAGILRPGALAEISLE